MLSCHTLIIWPYLKITYLYYRTLHIFGGIKPRGVSVKGNLKKLGNDVESWYLNGTVASLILVSLLHYTQQHSFFFNFYKKETTVAQHEITQWGPKCMTWFGNLCLLPLAEYHHVHLNRF